MLESFHLSGLQLEKLYKSTKTIQTVKTAVHSREIKRLQNLAAGDGVLIFWKKHCVNMGVILFIFFLQFNPSLSFNRVKLIYK